MLYSWLQKVKDSDKERLATGAGEESNRRANGVGFNACLFALKCTEWTSAVEKQTFEKSRKKNEKRC